MKRLSVILILFLLYLPLSAQFKGTVYIDTDQSDIFNKGDKPLAGVMVTDGLNVAKTDKKGRFSLPGFEKHDSSLLQPLPDTKHSISTCP